MTGHEICRFKIKVYTLMHLETLNDRIWSSPELNQAVVGDSVVFLNHTKSKVRELINWVTEEIKKEY